MTTFKRVIAHRQKESLSAKSRMAVFVRVGHKSLYDYIKTDVTIGCHVVRGKVYPNWHEEMVTHQEEGWIEKNTELERIVNLLKVRMQRVTNLGGISCKQLCEILQSEDIDKGTPLLLSEVLRMYVEDKTGSVSEAYLKMVRSAVERFCDWQGDVFVQKVTPRVMVEYDKYLHKVTKLVQVKGAATSYRVAKRESSRTKLSEAQINKEKSQLKAVLNWCVKQDLCSFEDDLFKNVVIPRSCSRDCSVGHDEVLTLMSADLDGNMALVRDIWLLSFYMGGMNWCDMRDVSWGEDVITFERSKTRGRGKVQGRTKLPVCAEAREILIRRCNKRGKFLLPWKCKKEDQIRMIGKNMVKLRKLLHLPESFSFYSARHTFAQMALECGICDAVVDYILSHTSNRGVISYYSTITPKMAGMAMARVREYLVNPAKFDEQMLAGLLR